MPLMQNVVLPETEMPAPSPVMVKKVLEVESDDYCEDYDEPEDPD